LNVFPIVVPPLREREGDVRLLAHFFADAFGRELGKTIKGISDATLQRLIAYDWPGNVRELQNLVERAVVLARGPILDFSVELAPGAGAPPPAPATASAATPARAAEPDGRSDQTLDAVQRQHILDVLARTRWVIDGPAGAAQQLGINASTLRSRMKKLRIGRRPGP
jgi:transcriptional regulator with GAF, ATPase, and Fis domain